MTDSNVKSLERQRFKQHLTTLAMQAEVSDSDFSDAIYQAIAAYGLNEDDIRDTFGTTKGAVDRWTMGKNLPQPMVRCKILSWIKDKL